MMLRPSVYALIISSYKGLFGKTTMKPTPLFISLETVVKHLYFHPFGKAESWKPIADSEVLQKLYYAKVAASGKAVFFW
jgi:hypothetical protein